MKLSEVVKLLNLLESKELNPDITDSIKHLWGIVDVVSNHRVQIENTRAMLAQDVVDLENNYNKFCSTVQGLKDNLRSIVSAREQEMFNESQRLYEQEMVFETADYILNRKFQATDEGIINLQSRIRNYGDWRLPGMIIRPGREKFIEEMVPLDPLYIVDTMPELISPSVEKFTLEYQRRLRTYVVNDYRDARPLHQLPDNQFGFIFAYNFLNYKPLPVIERYIRDIAQKLRPGGHAVFTFNDCDYAQGVGLAENSFMCYTPGHRVQKIVTDAGLEIDTYQHDEYDLAWMDVRRPGDIFSMRGGQTLAKIIPK